MFKSTIFHLYRGIQFYLWRKPEYSEKTTDLSLVTDKLKIELKESSIKWSQTTYKITGINLKNSREKDN
jgi:hypothetical protein